MRDDLHRHVNRWLQEPKSDRPSAWETTRAICLPKALCCRSRPKGQPCRRHLSRAEMAGDKVCLVKAGLSGAFVPTRWPLIWNVLERRLSAAPEGVEEKRLRRLPSRL